MAHRRGAFRGRGISDSQRRKKGWFQLRSPIAGVAGANALFTTSIVFEGVDTAATPGDFDTVLFASVSDPSVALGDEQSTLPEESTILRARGSLLFPKNEVSGTPLEVASNYAFGFGVTDIRSIVSGVAPGPIIDADWDGWMFLRQSGVSPVDSEGTMVDVKAMRKIKSGDAFFMSAQAVSGNAAVTPGGVWLFDLRLLILLP